MSYAPLHDKSEESSQHGEDNQRLLSEDQEGQFTKSRRGVPLWAQVILGLCTAACLVAFGAWIGSHSMPNENAVCLEHVQKWCRLSLCLHLNAKADKEKRRFKQKWIIHITSSASMVL
jgi:hypothetical protein